jgi:DNA-binding response OmpR family regulator
MSDGSFALPNVRIVILDDQAVEEDDRSWLLTRIRKRLPDASLLYIARNQSDTNEKRARSNGAHYYASKPLSFGRFGYVLQSFLRAKKWTSCLSEPSDSFWCDSILAMAVPVVVVAEPLSPP